MGCLNSSPKRGELRQRENLAMLWVSLSIENWPCFRTLWPDCQEECLSMRPPGLAEGTTAFPVVNPGQKEAAGS